MDTAINLENVKIGRTKNHLVFTGYVPSLSNFYTYEFDFTGTELTSTSALLGYQLESLREKLLEDFGYPPYSESDAKEILGSRKQYRI